MLEQFVNITSLDNLVNAGLVQLTAGVKFCLRSAKKVENYLNSMPQAHRIKMWENIEEFTEVVSRIKRFDWNGLSEKEKVALQEDQETTSP